MKEVFDHARFVRLSLYYCQQQQLYLSSKIVEVKAQALRQMEAVDKEQNRMLAAAENKEK